MSISYGRKKLHTGWVDMHTDDIPISAESEPDTQPGFDRYLRCAGCPYPRSGLTCYNAGDGECLLTDMHGIEAAHQKRYMDGLPKHLREDTS